MRYKYNVITKTLLVVQYTTAIQYNSKKSRKSCLSNSKQLCSEYFMNSVQKDKNDGINSVFLCFKINQILPYKDTYTETQNNTISMIDSVINHLVIV